MRVDCLVRDEEQEIRRLEPGTGRDGFDCGPVLPHTCFFSAVHHHFPFLLTPCAMTITRFRFKGSAESLFTEDRAIRHSLTTLSVSAFQVSPTISMTWVWPPLQLCGLSFQHCYDSPLDDVCSLFPTPQSTKRHYNNVLCQHETRRDRVTTCNRWTTFSSPLPSSFAPTVIVGLTRNLDLPLSRSRNYTPNRVP